MSNIVPQQVALRGAPSSSLARDADATVASGEIVTLSAEESRHFLRALDAPFQPNARLANAMARAAQSEVSTER